MPDIREALGELVARLSADGTLDDHDLAVIHDAAIGQANAIIEDRRWAELAQVHDEPHTADAVGLACCDCRRGLVADVTELRVLVCPTLHGRRPRDMVPVETEGAVECGRA